MKTPKVASLTKKKSFTPVGGGVVKKKDTGRKSIGSVLELKGPKKDHAIKALQDEDLVLPTSGKKKARKSVPNLTMSPGVELGLKIEKQLEAMKHKFGSSESSPLNGNKNSPKKRPVEETTGTPGKKVKNNPKPQPVDENDEEDKEEDEEEVNPQTSPKQGKLKKPKASLAKAPTAMFPKDGTINLDPKSVMTAVKAALKFQQKDDKLTLFPEKVVLLTVDLFKVPKGPKKYYITFKWRLSHLYQNDGDVCCFVPDTHKVKNDPDAEIEYWKEYYASRGVTNITEFIPVRKLATDYKTFESQRKLVTRFKYFIADGRIFKQCRKLGRKLFTCGRRVQWICVDKPGLKKEVDNALNRLSKIIKPVRIHLFNIGSTDMSPEHLRDHVLETVESLKTLPGGHALIKSLGVKVGTRGRFLPLYFNLRNPNEVKAPIVKREKKEIPVVADELSTIPGATAVVYPSGNVKIHKFKGDDEDDIEDSEVQSPKAGKNQLNKVGQKKPQEVQQEDDDDDDDDEIDDEEDEIDDDEDDDSEEEDDSESESEEELVPQPPKKQKPQQHQKPQQQQKPKQQQQQQQQKLQQKQQQKSPKGPGPKPFNKPFGQPKNSPGQKGKPNNKMFNKKKAQ